MSAVVGPTTRKDSCQPNVSRCAAKSEYPKGRCFLTRGNMQPAKYIPWGYYRDSFLRGHDAREVCELQAQY